MDDFQTRLAAFTKITEECDGIQVMEAWEAMIEDFLRKPYPDLCVNVRSGISIAPGWIHIVSHVCDSIRLILKENPTFHVKFNQIKEKFGGLRMYTQTWSDGAPQGEYGEPGLLYEHEELRALVSKIIVTAAQIADNTCQTCGEAGMIRNNGWMRVACDRHEKIKS